MPTEDRVGHLKDYDPESQDAVVHIDHGEIHQGDTIHVKAPGVDYDEKVEKLVEHGHRVLEAHQGEDVHIQLLRPLRRPLTSMLERVSIFVVHDPYEVEDGSVLASLFGTS